MSDLFKKLELVRHEYGRGLVPAQDGYARLFKRPVDDREINRQIDELYNAAYFEKHSHVAIPIELLLAVRLREGWRVEGRIPKSRMVRLRTADIIKEGQHQVAEAVNHGVEKQADARKTVAEEISKQVLKELNINLAPKTILKRMPASRK